MRKVLFFAIITFVCPFVSLLSSTVQGKDLTIGVCTPLSGGAAPNGLACLRSLEIVSDLINTEGGIQVGKETYLIKLIPYDNKYDAKEAVTITNRLIFSDKVQYIATLGATCVIAMNPLTNENKVIHLAYAYGGKKATNPNFPYTFRTVIEPTQGYQILLPWIVQKYGIKTIALTSTDDETGLIQAEDAEKMSQKLGLKITDKSFAPRGTADFTPMLTRLIAKKPDAIDFGSWGGSEGPLACKQTKELGYKGKMIFSFSQSIPTFEKVAGGFMDGVLFFNIFETDPSPLATKVAQKYVEKYKEKFDPHVWRYTDVPYLLKKAMETAGTPDTTEVRNALHKVSIDGIFGPTRIGGKSYYGVDCQFLAPVPLVIYDGKQKKPVELYRGIMPEGY
jgi:branched-chain amino acid transport system substrate-binding protein